MQYTPHYEPEYVGESIRALVRLYNNDSISNLKQTMIEKRTGRVTEEQLAPLLDYLDELLSLIGSKIDLSDPRADLLLSPRESNQELIQAIYIRHRGQVTQDQFRTAIAVVVDEHNPSETEPVFTNDMDFFNWLDTQDIPVEDKYAAWKLCVNFQEYDEFGLGLINQVSEILRQNLPRFQAQIDDCMNQFRQEFDAKGFGFLGDCSLTMDERDHHQVYVMLFQPNAISMFYSSTAEINDFGIGISFFPLGQILRDDVSRKENVTEFLKALSDGTKLAILQKLLERRYYSSELAVALGLTGPTISHHMGTLVNLRVVSIEKVGNRVYYNFNGKMIRRYTDDLLSLLGNPE